MTNRTPLAARPTHANVIAAELASPFRNSVVHPTTASKIFGRHTVKWSNTVAKSRNAWRSLGKAAPYLIAFDIAYAGADIIGSPFSEGAKWVARSGRESDWVGGAYAGFANAVGRDSLMVGFSAIGAIAGSAGGPIGTAIGIGAGLAAGFATQSAWNFAVGDYFTQRGRMFSSLAESGMARQKVQFGGNFRDSQGAYTMRQLAVQEMAGSLLNARQYLGNEGYFMHR